METIIYTLVISAGLSLILGLLLGFFKKIFYVQVDPLIEKVRECLPGANCGACGFPGCDGFATAVASGKASCDGCSAGGVTVAKAVGKVMGVDSNAVQQIAVLACRGTKDAAVIKGFYSGVQNCRAAKISINGTKMCSFGCIGFGDCVQVCKFDAIKIDESGIPYIDAKKCTGCGMCVAACPQNLLIKIPTDRKGPIPLCSNRSTNKSQLLKNCKAACIKCGKCERNCKPQALHLENGIPLIDYELCNSCGDCVTGCPTGVLTMMGK